MLRSRDEIAADLIKAGYFAHGFTYSSHPTTSAAALANLDVLENDNLITRVRDEIGPYFQQKLHEFAGHPAVGEIRGFGLIGALEMVPRAGKAALTPTTLLGVKAAIAESYERIHRSNLVGMGVLPLQFQNGENAKSLCLTGEEVYDVAGLVAAVESGFANGRQIKVRATAQDGTCREFPATVRIDTPQEVLYYKHGGILQYVLRQLLGQK